MSPRAQVGTALGAWVALLLGLAALWVRSPWTGPGPMFLLWSAPAATLTVITWRWLGRLGVTQVPRGAALAAVVVCLWLGAVWVAWSGIGSELVLDGDIMRHPELRRIGTALEWVPGLFGLAVSIAGLAASLEARYRVRHGQAGASP